MSSKSLDSNYFGKEKIGKILFKIAPPVMLAQLIQAMYNIIDSFFVGRFSDDALTALSVIYPMQLIIIALSVGSGVGVNTYMARKYAQGRPNESDRTAGTGMVLAIVMWAVFALASTVVMRPYVMTSAKSQTAIEYAVTYGRIVCIGSLGVFLESIWSKVLQSNGNMRLPMIAQIAGAVTNIILDPLLIFGIGFFPEMGVAGAAVATVIGQFVSAAIVGVKAIRKPPSLVKMGRYIKRIFYYGYSSIVMQALFTVYILALNMILAGFSDSAVTVLGLYYKLQSFFFIPLLGLQTCIVPLLSYNFTAKNYARCKRTVYDSIIFSLGLMTVGALCFAFMPVELISLFSGSESVKAIGKTAFPIIGCSFIPAVFALITTVCFQAIGLGRTSLALSLIRQIFCLIPLFKLFSLFGLNYTWIAFPVSEVITAVLGVVLYIRETSKWKFAESRSERE